MSVNHTPAVVGFALGDRVIFNVVEREGSFGYTGMSIVHHHIVTLY